ncbi:MAG: hypothetical protein Q9210_003447 [Variospora velana]
MYGSWSSAQVHAELRNILSIREAGNRAFRSGDYALSTEKYGEANYDILWLKGLRYTKVIPTDDWSIVEAITEMQYTTQSNGAASFLKYDAFSEVDDNDNEVSRFRKALNCTLVADEGLRDHPTRWKPSENAKRKLLYRRAQAYEGLEDYDRAWEAIQGAHHLSPERDEAICGLAMKIWKVREYGKDGAEAGSSTSSPHSQAPPSTYVQSSTPTAPTNLNNGSFSLSARPAFGRKHTADVLKGLPALPFKSLDVPQTSYHRPISDIETVSSLYSQPSPEMQSCFMPERLHIPHKPNGQSHDVSPPESLRHHRNHSNNSDWSSPNVSPVTENSSPIGGRPLVNGKSSSNIPVLKKTQRFGSSGNRWPSWKGRAVEVKSPVEDRDSPPTTRWDDYSGERTTSEKGKPGQVTPGSIPFDPTPGPGPLVKPQVFGTTTTISGGPTPVRRKRVPSRDENLTPAVREEWKGASGRHKIINPLKDKPLPPGVSAVFPTGSRKLSESPTNMIRTRDAISPTSGLALSAISDESTPTRATFIQPSIKVDDSPVIDSPGSAAITSPISIVTPPSRHPESNPDIRSPPEIDTSCQRDAEPTEDSTLSPDDLRSPLARHPSGEGLTLKPQPQPPTPEATPNRSRESRKEFHDYCDQEKDFRANFQQMNLEDQPPSRFSATTYATTAYNSPPATPETTHESPKQTPPSSILNRKRPVPVAGLPNKRKLTPSEAEQARENRHTKTLPKSPPEIEAQTRVASLQAALDGLRRRRNNIQTVLHELTDVVQPSSIAYDMAAKKEIKKTVEGLNRELAAIVKEEHETGLQLHRAWKRQDNNSAYEPTTLWVRRVTT